MMSSSIGQISAGLALTLGTGGNGHSQKTRGDRESHHTQGHGHTGRLGGGGGGAVMEVEDSGEEEFVQRKKFEVSGLPKGWFREEIVRRSGLSAGKVDVTYLSPDGRKFRSKPQLVRFLGDSLDLSTFDFRTGKSSNLLLRKNKRQRSQFDYSSRGIKTDVSLLPPIRQTASIFKQPVTVSKTQESRVKVDFKHGLQDKPKQLFWEKRLEGLRACDPSGEELVNIDLPQGVSPVGPRIASDTVLQSVATALHVTTQPIIGQTGSKVYLETNPGVFLNPEQPLIHALAVNEDDIRVQEDRVMGARKKLEEALRAFFEECV